MIKLTELQKEMLLHRLAVPCAIKEVFADTDNLSNISEDDIDSAITRLETMVNNGQFCKQTMNLSYVESEVLIDVVQGSTFFGNVYIEETAHKAHAMNRSADNLEQKLFEEFKLIVNFPRA